MNDSTIMEIEVAREKAMKTYLLYCPSVQLVKIGRACNPLGRMKDLRTMNAAAVEPIAVLKVPEAELHERFAEFRHHGEWFRISDEMVDYLDEIDEIDASNRLRIDLDRISANNGI